MEAPALSQYRENGSTPSVNCCTVGDFNSPFGYSKKNVAVPSATNDGGARIMEGLARTEHADRAALRGRSRFGVEGRRRWHDMMEAE
jgi:hypothetical protein